MYEIERNSVHLNVLPCCNVEDAISVTLRDFGQAPHLVGKYSPGRKANPQHECSGFTLFIDPHRHAEGLKMDR